MDIAKFESLLELPLTIKEVNSYGSWGGEGSDPAILFSTEDKYVPIYQIKEAFEDIAFIDPNITNIVRIRIKFILNILMVFMMTYLL